MRIQPVVEGHGEVSAFPELLRRLVAAAGTYEIEIARPIRRHRDELLDEEKLKAAVTLAKRQPGCAAILVLFDSDGDCPKEVMVKIRGWANAAAGTLPCEIVMAHHEYEAWFLCAIESLRGSRGIDNVATSHPAPETVRDAKGQLEQRMTSPKAYAETTDQAALSALFDLSAAHRASRSFRRLARAFARVVSGAGIELVQWPPVGW